MDGKLQEGRPKRVSLLNPSDCESASCRPADWSCDGGTCQPRVSSKESVCGPLRALSGGVHNRLTSSSRLDPYLDRLRDGPVGGAHEFDGDLAKVYKASRLLL